MNNHALEDQITFLGEIEKLKSITRQNRTIDDRYENSAEHSWHVALMGLVLQEYADEPVDMLKVTRMLLIHDIVEIDAGDTWLFAEDQGNKLEAENLAAKRLFSLLPEQQSGEHLQLWHEFEQRNSAEARFAAAIDGIQPLLNHLLTGRAEDGVIAADKVRAHKDYIRNCAPRLWTLVENLIQSSVDKGLYD